MAFTLEQLMKAAADLNKTLVLDPPIVAQLDSKGRGAAKVAAEKKFAEQLEKDILEVALEKGDGKDGKFVLQLGDVPLLQAETLEVIYALSPETKQRLNPSPAKAGKAGKKDDKETKPPKEPKEKKPPVKKQEGPGVIASILEAIPKKGSTTLDKIHEFLIARFPERDKDAMRKTINAQLGGKKVPTRLEREKKVTLTISEGKVSYAK